MAVSAGMALMSTATVAMTGGTFILGSFMSHFLVSTAMGAALRALTPKPSLGGANAANRGYQVTQRGAAVDHQVIYGQTRVGGVVVYDTLSGDDNEYLHRVVAFAGHEIEEFTTFYLNDVAVTLSGSDVTNEEFQIEDGSGNFEEYAVRINTHLGTDDQTADSDLVSEVTEWTTNHRLRGIAYAYFRFKYDPNVFDQGIPDISAVIKGKKVYDPRSETTVWSDNPALCMRDYMISDYGLAEDSANIDDTLVSTAANVCDYYNYPTLTGDPRFTLNGAFLVSSTPYDVLTDLSSAMGGLLWYSQGKWRMKPAYYTNPVMSLDEDDLRSTISVSTRHSRRDNFNIVKGVYRGPDTNYQPTDYTPVTDAGFLTIDGNQESVLNLDLPYTDDFDIARRLALITLERNRQQITVQASFGLKAFRCQVGDIIQLTNSRFGWSSKEFEVISWNFGLQNEYDLQVHLTLRETSENVFDDISDGATLELDNTELADPKGGLLVTNVSVSDKGNIQRDGTFVGQAEVSWTAVSNPYLNHYEVQWKDVDETAYLRTEAPRGQTSVIIGPLETGVQYDVRVRAVTVSEVKGSWVSATAYTHGGDTTAPSPVTGLSATGGPKNVTLDWTAPTTDSDTTALYDLKGYNIYRSTSNSQPASPAAFSGSDKYVDGGLAQNTTYYYWVTAVDFTGNESTAVASGAVSTDAAVVIPEAEDTRIYTGIVYYQTLQATAPNSGNPPSATSFNESTLTFGGLTSGWATTQPFVDGFDFGAKEWKSSYKVEFDKDDNVTITFTTPTGSFQFPDDIASDNYNGDGEGTILGTQGWYINRDTAYAEFGSAAIRDTLSVGQIPNLTSTKITDLGSLATQNTVDYDTEIDNTPDLSDYVVTSELNSKSTVIYSSSTPTSTSTNDLWYKTTEDRYYRYNGSSWVPVAITADSIVASYVYAGNINASQITAGTISVDYLPGLTFADVVTGGDTSRFNTTSTANSTAAIRSALGYGAQTMYRYNNYASLSGIVAGSTLMGTATLTIEKNAGSDPSGMNTCYFVLYDGSTVVTSPCTNVGAAGNVTLESNGYTATFTAALAIESAVSGTATMGFYFSGGSPDEDEMSADRYSFSVIEFTK
jgi:hypothetical protein